MSGIGFKMPSNAVFFNDKYVTDEVDKAEKRVLSRFGFLTRQDAKRSMRRKKNPSKPGKPPRVVTGLLKNFIFFAYDKFKQSVVVGPALLTGFKDAGKALTALEHGSSIVEARPFMDPAFQKNIEEHMPDIWRDSIR